MRPPSRREDVDSSRDRIAKNLPAALRTTKGIGGRRLRTAKSPLPLGGSGRTMGGAGGSNWSISKRLGTWLSMGLPQPMPSGPRRAKRRARLVAILSGDNAAGPHSVNWAVRGRSGWALKVKPTTGAPGGFRSRSRRIKVSKVFTSRLGEGNRIERLQNPLGSKRKDSSSWMQANPRESRREQRRPRAARATNRNGSSETRGQSKSIPSLNISHGW